MNLRTSQFDRLRFIGYVESISFVALLFVAMPLKYLYGQPKAVSVVGMVHGLLFMLYLFAAAQAGAQYGWGIINTILCILSSFLPFGPLAMEKRLAEFVPEAATGR